MVNRSMAMVCILTALLFAAPAASVGIPIYPQASEQVSVYVGDLSLPDRAWVEEKAAEATILFGGIVNIIYEEAPSEVSGGNGPICDWLIVTLVDDTPPVEFYTDPVCLIEMVQEVVNG